MPPAPRSLLAGRVGRPHGLDGSFYVRQPRADLLVSGAHVELDGEVHEITRRAGTDRAPILRLEGCRQRGDAAALTGKELRVVRDAAPALAADEYYAEQLVGCRVLAGGREIGEVVALIGLPSCEVLEVVRENHEPLWVPFVRDAVPRVDIGAGELEIDLGFLGVDAPHG